MTTTLRPTEPLQQNPDGTRSRRYQVCVNSRPVGAVHLGTHPVFGDAVARITSLHIEEPDRRRGRGTVAALAAEEVVRGWGCRRIEVAVPADAGPALRLATALGYVVRSRGMEKPLGDTPPALPEGSGARPMTDAEYGPWKARGDEKYARDWIARGVPEAEARAKAERDNAVLLPEGRATGGMLFSVLEHEGTPVGTLWLSVREEHGYVFDVETDAAHRGRGHGRSLMLLAEAQAIAAGKRTLGLNVFAGNTPAERLYASLGYGTVGYAMYKTLL
ncbi:GNAT family N-acetyltransferase [Streptomyces griseomycini]|uniref:GNAT superfamily N-acetyltransferase n=1 Tax=Streptomyces griseomycini TaxID=66895 RepID=A0A7W7PST8_9ACTN|nr:GNAT family N-acetyltransferase [Streptomyces griseomycini]MBB4900640.1 GNAT superfamily N-acetyltransferase [Streptomyces griseomycini]GGQ01126.1 N-acetyltransferase [Streptomyces griseomycini]GGR10684.1 N-acetyltransferase [Streptomyces griseomycini]